MQAKLLEYHPVDATDDTESLEKAETIGWGKRFYEALDMRKATVAQASRAIGVTPAAVRRWAQTDVPPRGRHLLRLSSYLKVSPYWLLFGEGPREEIYSDKDGFHWPDTKDGKPMIAVSESLLGELEIPIKGFRSAFIRDPSFKDVLPVGELALLNGAQNCFLSGCLHIVEIGGQTMVRRIKETSRDKDIVLRVDSNEGKDITYSASEWVDALSKGDVTIVGRIIAAVTRIE